MEKFPNNTKEVPCPVYEVDLRKAWNTESYQQMFMEGVRKLVFYRPDLMYSGFDGSQIGTSSAAKDEFLGEDGVFCCNEKELLGLEGNQSAIRFALEYDVPVIAIYDPQKLNKVQYESYAYTLQDPSALIAYVKLKV